ncbi:MAG TPA: alpha/beta fold hydrolase [Anaerolineales bacterium]|nr:alpha/beta fold hydrolase [Anaerolineales bacterium]
MKAKHKNTRWLWLVVILAAVFCFAPYLVPIPPLTNTQSPAELAFPDSQFIEVNGLYSTKAGEKSVSNITLHYLKKGTGAQTLVLLHGFGASTFSWRPVLDTLAQDFTVIAYDRPAFGLTERPTTWEKADWADGSPYSLASQVILLQGLLDALGVEQAILVGHSAGASVAVAFALAQPQRVQALVLEAPAIIGGGAPSFVKALTALPQLRRLGPLLVRNIAISGPDTIRQAWHDPSKISAETLAGYQLPLQAEHWDTALWEFTLARQASGLESQLANVTHPTWVIAGDDDRIVPTENSRLVSEKIPTAEWVLVPACGHLPHEEKPAEFLQVFENFK